MKKCEIDTADNVWRRVVKALKMAGLILLGLGFYAGSVGGMLYIDDTYGPPVMVWVLGSGATIIGLGFLFLCGLILHWIFCVDDRSEQAKCYHKWGGKGRWVKCKKCGFAFERPKPLAAP